MSLDLVGDGGGKEGEEEQTLDVFWIEMRLRKLEDETEIKTSMREAKFWKAISWKFFFTIQEYANLEGSKLGSTTDKKHLESSSQGERENVKERLWENTELKAISYMACIRKCDKMSNNHENCESENFSFCFFLLHTQITFLVSHLHTWEIRKREEMQSERKKNEWKCTRHRKEKYEKYSWQIEKKKKETEGEKIPEKNDRRLSRGHVEAGVIRPFMPFFLFLFGILSLSLPLLLCMNFYFLSPLHLSVSNKERFRRQKTGKIRVRSFSLRENSWRVSNRNVEVEVRQV